MTRIKIRDWNRRTFWLLALQLVTLVACNGSFAVRSSVTSTSESTDSASGSAPPNRGRLINSNTNAARSWVIVLTPDDWEKNLVATKMQGQSISSGEKGERLDVSFTGKKNWCYTLLVNPKNAAATPKVIDHLNLRSPKGASYAQFFRPYVPSVLAIDGVCLTDAAVIRGTMKAKLAGSKSRLAYVVVGWPRGKVPGAIVGGMTLYRQDACDPKGWSGMWTNPVPGSIVFTKNEPYLLLYEDQPHLSSGWSTLMNMAGGEMRVQKKNLFDQPEGKIEFRVNTTRQPTCNCVRAASSYYTGNIVLANAARREALTSANYKAADRIMRKNIAAQRKAVQKECKGKPKQSERNWKKTLDDIVDHYATATPREPIIKRASFVQTAK